MSSSGGRSTKKEPFPLPRLAYNYQEKVPQDPFKNYTAAQKGGAFDQ